MVDLRLVVGSEMSQMRKTDVCAIAITLLTSFILLIALHFCYVQIACVNEPLLSGVRRQPQQAEADPGHPPPEPGQADRLPVQVPQRPSGANDVIRLFFSSPMAFRKIKLVCLYVASIFCLVHCLMVTLGYTR